MKITKLDMAKEITEMLGKLNYKCIRFIYVFAKRTIERREEKLKAVEEQEA